jgi:hypothetical protein
MQLFFISLFQLQMECRAAAVACYPTEEPNNRVLMTGQPQTFPALPALPRPTSSCCCCQMGSCLALIVPAKELKPIRAARDQERTCCNFCTRAFSDSCLNLASSSCRTCNKFKSRSQHALAGTAPCSQPFEIKIAFLLHALPVTDQEGTGC